MHPLREKAKKLRRQGRSYGEIEARLGIGRSTLAYILRDIRLSKEQQQRLDCREKRNRERFGKFWKDGDPVQIALRREAARQQTLERCSARTSIELEDFRAKMRAVALRRTKQTNPPLAYPPRTLDTATYRMCLRKAPHLGIHPNWNYVMSRGRAGYVSVKCSNHPNRDARGYVAVHRLMAECQLERFLTHYEVAHHINGNTRDNTVGNVAVTSRRQHSKIHARPSLLINVTCSFCGKQFTRPKRRKLPPSGRVFDSRSCAARFYGFGITGVPSPRRLPPKERRRRQAAYMRSWRKRQREKAVLDSSHDLLPSPAVLPLPLDKT